MLFLPTTNVSFSHSGRRVWFKPTSACSNGRIVFAQPLMKSAHAFGRIPTIFKAAVWLYHYYQRQGNGGEAQAALHEYRQSKEARQADWTAEELFALLRLFEAVRNYNESARFAYALYSLPGASGADREGALSALILLLLAAPDQPIAFGAGDLSLYRDIATMDDQPGFLNGILSLLFNEQGIDYRFASQERASVAYFHRARAAEVLKLFDGEFPSSDQRAARHAGVIAAYAIYGDNGGVVEKGRGFLTAFPDADERSQVSLLMAEAYAREGQTTEEFAVYDALLAELAAKADGVPLGAQATPRPAGSTVSVDRRCRSGPVRPNTRAFSTAILPVSLRSSNCFRLFSSTPKRSHTIPMTLASTNASQGSSNKMALATALNPSTAMPLIASTTDRGITSWPAGTCERSVPPSSIN